MQYWHVDPLDQKKPHGKTKTLVIPQGSRPECNFQVDIFNAPLERPIEFALPSDLAQYIEHHNFCVTYPDDILTLENN